MYAKSEKSFYADARRLTDDFKWGGPLFIGAWKCLQTYDRYSDDARRLSLQVYAEYFYSQPVVPQQAFMGLVQPIAGPASSSRRRPSSPKSLLMVTAEVVRENCCHGVHFPSQEKLDFEPASPLEDPLEQSQLDGDPEGQSRARELLDWIFERFQKARPPGQFSDDEWKLVWYVEWAGVPYSVLYTGLQKIYPDRKWPKNADALRKSTLFRIREKLEADPEYLKAVHEVKRRIPMRAKRPRGQGYGFLRLDTIIDLLLTPASNSPDFDSRAWYCLWLIRVAGERNSSPGIEDS
ncbi:MAG: hypothetical protein KJ058_02285 [Thermoanaerobaculia bacterium]|nr:hypothetical protein [Thermoanaerobaculia bacterium]